MFANRFRLSWKLYHHYYCFLYYFSFYSDQSQLAQTYIIKMLWNGSFNELNIFNSFPRDFTFFILCLINLKSILSKYKYFREIKNLFSCNKLINGNGSYIWIKSEGSIFNFSMEQYRIARRSWCLNWIKYFIIS